MFWPSGERCSMIDSIWSKPAMPLAASVRTGPAEIAFTRIPRGPELVGQVAHAGFERGLGAPP